MNLLKLAIGTVAYTATSVLAHYAAKRVVAEINATKETPVNFEHVGTKTINGHTIAFNECDHFDGDAWNAMAHAGLNTVTVTRNIKNSPYYKAVLDHEIGHIVAAEHLTMFSSTADLYRIELQADKYSVAQGNLDALFEFRLRTFRKYWFAPVQYNTTNLMYLSCLKIKAKLSK